MKKLIFSLLLVCVCGKMPVMADCFPISIQQMKEEVKEIPNPEKAAQKLTDEMDELLQLTEKQYKKIYKLNLKEEKEKIERMTGKNSFEGGHPPMPPMGGMPPQGGFPPMNGMRIEKRNKKLKKILTDEQYEKWMSRKPEPEEPAMSLSSMPVE